MTHKDKLIMFFRVNEGREVNHRRLIDSAPTGLGISEYTGRIKDARNDFGCTCGADQTNCTATEHIVNTRTNYYMYTNSRKNEAVKPEKTVSKPVDLAELEARRKALVEEYKIVRDQMQAAQGEKKRSLETKLQIITVRGKALKRAIGDEFGKQVMENLA